MRRPRIKLKERAFYHCMSRSVEDRVLLRNKEGSSVEGEMFLALMRKLASFTGIRILTYALMSNHYHIECEVPEAFELCDEDLLARIKSLVVGEGQAVAAVAAYIDLNPVRALLCGIQKITAIAVTPRRLAPPCPQGWPRVANH